MDERHKLFLIARSRQAAFAQALRKVEEAGGLEEAKRALRLAIEMERLAVSDSMVE